MKINKFKLEIFTLCLVIFNFCDGHRQENKTIQIDSFYYGLNEYISYLNTGFGNLKVYYNKHEVYILLVEAVSKNDSLFFRVNAVNSLIDIYNKKILTIGEMKRNLILFTGDVPNNIIESSDNLIDVKELYQTIFSDDYKYFEKNKSFRLPECLYDHMVLHMTFKDERIVERYFD
jgi:hypothetical protein